MTARFAALAFDYDGTLTDRGRLSTTVRSHLQAVRASGTRLVLVTGRILAELRQVAPGVEEEFDAVVAENGAVLRDVDGVRDLAPSIDPRLAQALTHRDVSVRSGRVVLAGRARDAATALEEIGRLGLDCQLVRNRGELMILPSGITKGTGLLEALAELGVSCHSTLAVGDAENDLPLLAAAEVGVAVANAVDSLTRAADVVLAQPDGAGIVELLTGPVVSGARRILPRRRQLVLGHRRDGNPVRIATSPHQLLITGASGAGKSFLVGLLVERLVQQQYGVLVVDREGDHDVLAARRGLLVLGGEGGPPPPAEVVSLFAHRFASLVVDVSLLSAQEQDRYTTALLPLVAAHQLATGSPQWVVLDEAHALTGHSELQVPRGTGHALATHLPGRLPAHVRDRLDTVLALPGGGEGWQDVRDTVDELSGGGQELPALLARLQRGEAVLVRTDGSAPVAFALDARATRHVRHWHKYVDAQLPDHLRFRFGEAGCEGVAANIRELHRGLQRISTDALSTHLHHGDLSRWVREVLSQEQLAAAVGQLETRLRADAQDVETVRQDVLAAVEEHYLT